MGQGWATWDYIAAVPVRNRLVVARTNDQTEGNIQTEGYIMMVWNIGEKRGLGRGLLVPSADDCNVTPKPSRRRKHIYEKKGGEKEE